MSYLDANNYFTQPASKSRHNSFYGGLAYREASRIYENDKEGAAKDVDPKSIIVVTLLHDLCKLNRYEELPGQRYKQTRFDEEYPLLTFQGWDTVTVSKGIKTTKPQ